MNIEKQVHLIAVLWIALGSLSFLAGLALFGILFGVSFIPDIGSEAPVILRIVGSSLGVFFWMLSLPKIICGVGLLNHKEWARVLTLILSFLSLLNIPLGTALGIYSLVILMRDDAGRLFRKG